ncbi:beta-ketoacyl synthase N-terminal-like domain-containing protein, partial [Pseudomonas paraveronii]|uniref:beta-ketoacyl synthase N-terminal-like domain-containing protein n=1 Tax=Pseudomonas paraveronii TaxID=3040598 RepID=UPI002AAFFCC5
MSLESKRIVVTGMGSVSPLGCGVEDVWRRLLDGQSGRRALSEEFSNGVGCAVGGQVPSLEQDPVAGCEPELAVPAKDRRPMERFF